MSSDRNFMVYRGFSYLHARVLLYMQYNIERLEKELDRLDDTDSKNGNQSMLGCRARDDMKSRQAATGGASRTRLDVFAELKQQLSDYGKH